jgi:hypothetical protein
MPSERDQFDRLIAELPHRTLQLQEHVALALMVTSKWDKAYAKYGADPSPAQVAECDTFTEREVLEHRDSAARMMRDYAAAVAQPAVGWAVPIGQGVLAGFIYSLLLILVAFILHFSGVDILGVLENVAKGT